MIEQPTPPTTQPTPPSIPPTPPPPPPTSSSTPPASAPAPAQAQRRQFILWGAIAAAVVIVLIVVGLAVMRPSAASKAQPTKPGGLLFPGSDTASTPTPEWTLLPSSAQIRPGIYVRIVRPSGLDLFKAAGFDGEFIVTVPVEKIVYVLQGPVRANSLSWIQVSDGVATGWGVQDYVVAYGTKNTP